MPAAGELSQVVMELSEFDSVKAAAEAIVEKTPVIDYLILNAGTC